MTGIFRPVISYHHQEVMEKSDTALSFSPLFAEFVPAHSGIEQVRFVDRAPSSCRLRMLCRMLHMLVNCFHNLVHFISSCHL